MKEVGSVTTAQAVQELVYGATVRQGRPPNSTEVARALGTAPEQVLQIFRQLNARRLLALAPETGEIVMAPPFSAVPTLFHVTVGDRAYFANCVWDAYGIAAALHQDADIAASCGCCGEPMSLAVRDGRPVPATGIAHFAVPAAQWWENITYT
jgi:Alkylmercury lyase